MSSFEELKSTIIFIIIDESDVEALSSNTEKDIISITSTDEMFSSTLDLLDLPTTLTEFSVSSRFTTSFDIEPTPSYQQSLYKFVSSSIEELTVKDESSGVLSFSSLLMNQMLRL